MNLISWLAWKLKWGWELVEIHGSVHSCIVKRVWVNRKTGERKIDWKEKL